MAEAYACMCRDHCIACMLCKCRICLVWGHCGAAWKYRYLGKDTGIVVGGERPVVRDTLDLPLTRRHSTDSGKQPESAGLCDKCGGFVCDGRCHWQRRRPGKCPEDGREP